MGRHGPEGEGRHHEGVQEWLQPSRHQLRHVRRHQDAPGHREVLQHADRGDAHERRGPHLNALSLKLYWLAGMSSKSYNSQPGYACTTGTPCLDKPAPKYI